MVALERDGLEDAVAFDLGKDSLLEALYTSSADVRFRVGDYEPGETMSHHGPGKHVYLVNRRMLEADVIISVPKLKTHQKVGITCALKGTVGAIARKECLAHHRKGSPQEGGDEYPRAGTVSDLCSNMLERSCTLGTDPLSNAYRISSRLLGRLVRSTPRGITLGSWHGNDTAWRMTLDIARILMFGRLDGSLSPVPIRRHLALVDGVLGGEKEGPLTPLPRPTGVVLFGDDICAVDWACCFVMGFDPQKIPLLRNSLSISRFPLSAARSHEIEVCLNGEAAPLNSLAKAFSPQFRPPKGWVGKIELAGSWGAGSSEILGHDGRAAAL
jgi:hypothetical protein